MHMHMHAYTHARMHTAMCVCVLCTGGRLSLQARRLTHYARRRFGYHPRALVGSAGDGAATAATTSPSFSAAPEVDRAFCVDVCVKCEVCSVCVWVCVLILCVCVC